MEKKYKLRYSALFRRDLDEATSYITHTLNNPVAAERLVESVYAAIHRRLANPLITEIYPSSRPRKLPHRSIVAGNYRIFYVIDGNIMIVRRLLYGRRNLDNLL